MTSQEDGLQEVEPMPPWLQGSHRICGRLQVAYDTASWPSEYRRPAYGSRGCERFSDRSGPRMQFIHCRLAWMRKMNSNAVGARIRLVPCIMSAVPVTTADLHMKTKHGWRVLRCSLVSVRSSPFHYRTLFPVDPDGGLALGSLWGMNVNSSRSTEPI